MRSGRLFLVLCALRLVNGAAEWFASGRADAWVAGAAPGPTPTVIQVKAKRFSYSPSKITLKRGVPVVLELISEDRKHGFKVPELGIRSDVEPGKVVRLELTPTKVGTFAFACDIF